MLIVCFIMEAILEALGLGDIRHFPDTDKNIKIWILVTLL